MNEAIPATFSDAANIRDVLGKQPFKYRN